MAKVNNSNNSSGLTLLELLVVMTIVAVVSALALAGVRRIIEFSHRTECINNLRTLTMAALAWSGDHNGILLPVLVNHRPAGQTPQGLPWVGILWRDGYLTPDLRGRQDGRGTIFECRSRHGEQREVRPATYSLHYGSNSRPGFPSTQNSQQSNQNIRRLFEIESPSKTMAFAEVNRNYAIYPHLTNFRIYPHGGGMLASYFDGHIQWIEEPLPLVPNNTQPGNGIPFY